MKKHHRNKMNLPRINKVQQKAMYEYTLPQDEQQLQNDAIAYGEIDAIRDGVNDKTREEITAKAYALCEKLRSATRAESIANNFDSFRACVVRGYLAAYQEKQRRFKADSELCAADLAAVYAFGGWTKAYCAYRQHVNATVARLKAQGMVLA